MERVNEKYGWVVFLFLGLLWVVVGIVQVFSPGELLRTDAQLITGLSWSELKASSPIATDLVRFHYGGMGLLKTSWSFLVLAITLTGYRKGEKWAWYTLWLVPALLVCNAFYNVNFLGDVNHRCWSGSRLRPCRCWGSSFPIGSSSQDSYDH
jgi:cbb3-type cytochrome oxidase subunit 1